MIGDLYDVDNVVVGQAAAFFAPQNTNLPAFANLVYNDPFSTAPWTTQTLTMESASTAVLVDAAGNETTTITYGTTTGTEIETALNDLDDGASWSVTPTSTVGPYTIVCTDADQGPLTIGTSTGTVSLSGGLWVPCGATDQGWKYGTDKSVTTINIEEQSTPAGQGINTQAVTLDASLSEDISRTLQLAYNATLSSTAPADSVGGYDTLELTDTILYYSVALVAQNAHDLPRIIYAPKWSQLANTSTDFRRASAKRMYPVTFTTLCKPAQIQVIEFTAGPTS